MSVASIAAAHPQKRQIRLAAVMAARPLALGLAVAALVTALRLIGTVDSDVAWQLWIAGRIHAGAHLYRDIIEINPPLWFWMALPVDSLASLLHVRAESVLIVALGGLAALSLAATNRLLADILPGRRRLLLGYAALTMTAMPWVHAGQREQLVLMGSLPYAALIAARRQGEPVSPLLAALVGIGAALGFALKHYFLMVPLSLELWLLVGLGRCWRPVRAETAAIAMIGAGYVATILLWAPEFLTDVVPMIRLAYGVTGALTVQRLFGPLPDTAFACLGLIALHSRLVADRRAPFSAALIVASLAFAAVYFVQAKGWIYHAIPLLGCSSLALAALLAEAPAAPSLLRILAAPLLSMPLLLAADDARNPPLPSPDLIDAVSGMRPGDTVGFLAVEPAIPWSITLQRRLRYPSRYIGFWMMRAIVDNEQLSKPDPRLEALGRRVISETVADFTCTPPRRIIVARPFAGGEERFDILAFFLRDPRFAELLSHYRVRSRTTLETLDQLSPLRPSLSACRAGV